MEKTKKSLFDTPLLSSKVKSAKPKLFFEGVLGYFGGPTLALIANSFLSGYFNKYLTDLYGITSWAALFNTLLPILSVIFVVLGNILVGKLMDKGKLRAGKARPLLLLSLPVSLLALLILFVFSPSPDKVVADQSLRTIALILIAVGYNLWFAFAYPLYFTPHSALVNLSTRSSKDRSLLATLSNACNLGAMGLCTMVLPFFLGMLFKYDMNPTVAGALPYIEKGVTQYYYVMQNGEKSILYDVAASANAWKVFAIALIIVTAVGVILEFYFTRERVTEEALAMTGREGEQSSKKTITTKEQWKICRKDKFWIIMVIFFFLYQFGGMLKNVSQLYYCTAWFPNSGGDYTIESGGIFSGTIGIVGAIPTALGMVIAWPLSNKIGKGKAILFGAILSAIGGAIGFLVPVVPVDARFAITAVSFIIKALGSTPAMYLSIALLGDVMDHQEALHGKRTDGLSMTIYGAIMAGMTGIVTGVLNGVLSASNYNPQTPSTVQMPMLWLFIGGETICYLAIAIFFIFMKVEKFSKLDHKAIEADQRARCEKLGIEYMTSEERMAKEEADADAASEEARIKELKARCEKKGLSFEEEERKYQEAKAEKEKVAAAKKAEKEAKLAEKKRLEEEKLAAMSEEEKKALQEKEAAKAEKIAKVDKEIEEEFLKLRELTKADRELALFE